MKYYENHDDERADRIFDLVTKAIIGIVIAILITIYCVIDFKEIKINIKTEKNE